MDKFCFLPYDFDTAIGITNEGTLAFDYGLEDTDTTEGGADVYNGQQSVLWINVRQAFFDEIKSMYQELRSTGALSYAKVEAMFEEHQAVWPEAIFNEDAWYKYLQPLVEEGSAAYLPMLQGSKAEQRKWWLYNRFRYLDSKYNAGDALTDVITVRGYAKADITITPYADIYPTVKFGSYLVQVRGRRGNSYVMKCPLDNVNDTEIYIYSASQLADVGDLSGLMVGYADFSMAAKLQSLKLGDSAEGYSNGNLTELHLGNNVLLRTLDVRNCPNLAQAVDISGCGNIEEVYFDGTGITGLSLPNGGILKVLHLPETVTNLTIRNQTRLTDFSIPSYRNISTVRLENNSSAIDTRAILESIAAASRVRMIGIDWTVEDAEEIREIYDLLDTMRGLDENGGNMDTAQVSGTIHIESITGAELAELYARYPDIKIAYAHVTSQLYYYTYDGSTLLYTETIQDNGSGTYTGKPSRTSTAQYSFTFVGWSTKTNSQTADADALTNVGADRKVYAAYSRTVRTYTVYFYNGTTLLQTVTNVAYGSSATYTGDTPVSPDGTAEEGYEFDCWSPAPTAITGDTKCYAVFTSPLKVAEIVDTWDAILDAINDGTYKARYQIGNYKPLDLGEEGTVNMQIAAFDKDELADGSGTVPITWISRELLATSRSLNPTVSETARTYPFAYDEEEGAWYSTNPEKKEYIAAGEWDIKTPTACTLVLSYIANTTNWATEVIITANGAAIVNSNNCWIPEWTDYTLECAAGDVVHVTAYMRIYGNANYLRDHRMGMRFSGADDIVAEYTSTTEIIPYVAVSGTGAVGGWEASTLRAYLKDTLYPTIPEPVKSAILSVKKTQDSYDTSAKWESQETEDLVWIPSYPEMFETVRIYKTLFPDDESRIKSLVGTEDAISWWLRSARYYAGFYDVFTDGSSSSTTPGSKYGVALGFCTGKTE